MFKTSWSVALAIFFVSFSTLIILFWCLGVGVENIRAFAMWSTMTIGATGLYIAIEKFGIDSKSHSTKKLSCVLQQKGVENNNFRHVYELFNRSESDIYVKDFKFSKGELFKFSSRHSDFKFIWNKDSQSFFNVKPKYAIKDTNSIIPNDSLKFCLLIPKEDKEKFKIKIIYTEDDYYGDEKYIEVNLEQS